MSAPVQGPDRRAAGISTNLLSERLKELEVQGILCQRVLAPPAGSTVYELAAAGRALETAVLELGKWGSRLLPTSLEGNTLPSLGALSLALKAFFHPEQACGIEETLEFRFGVEALQVHLCEGELRVQQGQARQPGAVIHIDMRSFLGLFTGQVCADEAIASKLMAKESTQVNCCQLRGRLVYGTAAGAKSPVPGDHPELKAPFSPSPACAAICRLSS